MPFILAKLSQSVTIEQELQLKTLLGQAITVVPGKSEEVLMVGFEDNYHLYLRGENELPMAYIDISMFANRGHKGYEALSVEITSIFSQVLGILPNHIYLNYADIPSFSVNGMYFDDQEKR